MRLPAGASLTQEVMFASEPTGDLLWSVTDVSGSELDVGTIVVPTGAVSVSIGIAPAFNQTADLFAFRRLTWEYPTASGQVYGSLTYRIENALPVFASEDGVRTKLGVLSSEVDDNAIDLPHAWLLLTSGRDPQDITDQIAAGGLGLLNLINAVEAKAALALLDTLQIRLSKSVSSGTNIDERWSDVDWNALRLYLQGLIWSAFPEDTTINFGSAIFIVTTRPDPFTGE